MFSQTRKRLAVQFTGIIGAMLMILIALFVILLNHVASRSEATQLSELANRAMEEWRHHQMDGIRPDRQPRPSEQGRMSWEFVQPQQFIVVTDRDGTVTAQSPSDQSRTQAINQAVANSRKSGSGVSELRQVDGSKRIYSITVSSYSSLDGTSNLLFYAGEDETERKKLLLQIGWLLAGFSAALLVLSSITGYFLSGRVMIPITGAFRRQQQFTADASHELRTPLSVLQASLEVVQEEARLLPEFHRDILHGMGDEIGRMTRMTESLLQLARGDEQRLDPLVTLLDAAVLAQTVVRNMTPYAQKMGIAISYTGESEPVPVKGDEDQLGQVLYILLDNAVKYSYPGTIITVNAKRMANGRMEWIVRDTGIGIPEEDLPHIFERFYRVDKARSRDIGGTGLGLSVVASIIKAHGGQIDVSSRAGEGSTFTVKLPSQQ